MKKYLFIMIIILISVNKVYAECTDEEIANLKKEADKIEITYKHLGRIESEAAILTNQFSVTIKNIPNEMYIKEGNINSVYENIENNTVVDIYSTGKWVFEFYSSKCDAKIKTINVKLPKYNPYSENELCEGIDGNDLSVCNKYYDYDISYEMFEQRVKQYRAIYKIDAKKEEKKENNESFIDKVFDTIKDFVNKNKLYIGIGAAVVFIAAAVVALLIFRKRRGVLK